MRLIRFPGGWIGTQPVTLVVLVFFLLCGISPGIAQAPAAGPASELDNTDFDGAPLSPVAAAPSIVSEQAAVAATPPPSPPFTGEVSCCISGDCQLNRTWCRGPNVLAASSIDFKISVEADACKAGNSAYLEVSMWMDQVSEAELSASGGSPLMVLAQGLVPTVGWESTSELPSFFPPLSVVAPPPPEPDGSQIDASADSTTAAKVLTPGSFADLTAWLLSRKNHIIVAPIAPAIRPDPFIDLRVLTSAAKDQWHLTVANMASWLEGPPEPGSASIENSRYYLKAECLAGPTTAKCPVAPGRSGGTQGGDAIQCNYPNGVCSAETGALGQVPVCKCIDGWTGHACTVQAGTLLLGNSTDEGDNNGWIQLSSLNNGTALEPGQWAHLRVKLQNTQLVVVEMEQQVGNCMLIAKPRGQGQAPYDMPSILDFTEFGDVDAYRDHAKRAAHSLLRVGDVKSQEISVAVHNFEDSAIQSLPCEAMIRVRTVAAQDSVRKLCPFDCSDDQGTCPDLDPNIVDDSESTAATKTISAWNGVDDQLRCKCNTRKNREQPEYAGRFCQAVLEGVNFKPLVQLKPGEWRAHQFNVREGESETLSVQLTLGEKLDGEWSDHGYIVFVASVYGAGDIVASATAPRAPTPTQHDFIFQSGAGLGGPKDFTILADDLEDVELIMFAVYNIDQRADTNIDYTLQVQARTPKTILPIAVIVAIVIAGVVVLLVVIVLCIVIFRQCRARMQDPQVVLQQIGQRVVPPLDLAAIDDLETFSFEDLPKKTATMSARVLTPQNSEAGGKGSNPPNPTMCRICHDDYSPGDQLVRLPCGHIFHKSCSKKWLGEETATCPVCRLNLLDPSAGPMPSRTVGSYTETSFSVPGNLTTPVYTDSAPSVVSSDPLDQDGARRANTHGATVPSMSSERSFRSATGFAQPAMHSGTAPPSAAAEAAAAAVAAMNGDSPLSPNRSRSPLYRMFSGPACGTEPSGEGLSQEELFHSMPGESNISGVLHNVASASAIAGIPGAAVDTGGRFGEHFIEGGSDGRALPHGVSAVSAVSGGPWSSQMIRESLMNSGHADIAMTQYPYQHLSQNGGPMVVPAPTGSPVAPVVTAPGTVIPAPVGLIPAALSSTNHSANHSANHSGNHSGSPTCVVGLPGASGAVSVSHSGTSRVVSGVSEDFSGISPVGAGFGASGDLLSPLPGRPGYDYMHESLLGQMHGRSHHHAGVGALPNGELMTGAGPMMAWRPGQWATAPADPDMLSSTAAGVPLSHEHQHMATGAGGGASAGYAHNTVAMHDVDDPVDVQRARLSDGVGTASAATGSGLVGREASEDSLLNSDGGGTVAGDSGLEEAQFFGSARSHVNGGAMSPRTVLDPHDTGKS